MCNVCNVLLAYEIFETLKLNLSNILSSGDWRCVFISDDLLFTISVRQTMLISITMLILFLLLMDFRGKWL